MARERITPGTVGPVSIVPLGTTPDDDTERVIPAPRTDGGESLPYPKAWRVGGVYKVAADDGVQEFTLTRWRGLARAVDTDGKEYMIRRWRETKAAAVAATEQAATHKLADLEASRQRAAVATRRAAVQAAKGDTSTTVADLIERAMQSPAVAKLAARTRGEYEYSRQHVLSHDDGVLSRTLPRDFDVATVKTFLASFAQVHGSNGATKAKALLRRAMDLATEDAALHCPMNTVSAAHDAIPAVKKQDRGHEIHRAPTDDEVGAFLLALRDDPQAAPMLSGRNKSAHGHKGSVINGTDVADLLTLTFATGLRIGEASGLRWGDLVLIEGKGTATVTGTVIRVPGEGVVRQARTKTRKSARTVPLRDDIVRVLRARAEVFGIDQASEASAALPVFPSPQMHDRHRDPSNLAKAVRAAMKRHGMGWASSHTARRYRVTSLLDRGVPLGKVADVVGHSRIATTLGYVGRGRGTDDDVRAAL